MPDHVEYTELVMRLMAEQFLQGNNKRILQKITVIEKWMVSKENLKLINGVQDLLVNHSMGHDDRLIVTSGREQWVARVIGRTAYGIFVQPNRLIGFRRKIQIEPQHFFVIR